MHTPCFCSPAPLLYNCDSFTATNTECLNIEGLTTATCAAVSYTFSRLTVKFSNRTVTACKLQLLTTKNRDFYSTWNHKIYMLSVCNTIQHFTL